jgi:hypothetical protein
MLEFRYCEDPMEARRAEVVVGRKNTIWNLLALSKKHTVVIGGEVHRCGMPTIVIAASSERLVGRANMGRGSTLDRPPDARLRRQAPGPEYRQRPEERFNFPGFTGALER